MNVAAPAFGDSNSAITMNPTLADSYDARAVLAELKWKNFDT